MSKDNEFIPEDFEFENLVKKAKRKSTIKTVLISLVISLFVITALYVVGDWVMKVKMSKELEYDTNWTSIQGANIEEQGTSYDYTFFTAKSTRKIVKRVGNIPTPWQNEEKMFTVLGTSRIVNNGGFSATGKITDKRIPFYFEGERVIEFYHPQGTYNYLFDDRELLPKMDDNTVAELAFSFDKAYSVKEIENIFKDHAAWFWVDTYSQEDIEEHNEINQLTREHGIIGDSAFGFPVDQEPMSFITTLERLKADGGQYEESASEIFLNITNGNQEELIPENLDIIGVVVTGTPSELKKYQDVPIIRGAILGATTDKY
ncbi:anti sigma factor C-terminal domain-containing protein [Bacillus spongiae]|uniref:Anti sigma factor C-terminal domain-containing protein n=1 Tax=Bacillus spongiae TaxID=2683610 RepID=A0ABU8HGP3_9BACI